MASSGSFNTNGHEGRYLTFSWQETSQSVANNSTTITWTLKGAGTGQVAWYMAGNFKVVIAGKTVYASSTRIKLYNGTTVASGTYTFTHADDGTKSFTASAEAGIYAVAVNCTGSKTFTLDTIARASQPSCITWPEHTQNVGSFGDEISIHMNRKADTMTHTVRYQFGSQSGTIATGVTTGTTWVIPLSLMELIPNTTSGSGTIYVDTYNGSTKVGTKSCGFTATVPASVKPSLSVTLEDTTGIDDIYGSPVKGLSKIKITPKVTLAYGSPVASYTITANGVTYKTSTATTGFLATSGSSKVTVTVKDKRGRTATWTYTMTVLDYTSPAISKLTVRRCNEDGTENDEGEYVRITFSATITAMTNKNTAKYELRYKKSGDSDWTTLNPIGTNAPNAFTVVDNVTVVAADGNSSHDIEVIATDRHGATIRSTSVSTAFTLMNWGADGKSIGFCKVAEHPGAIDVGTNVYLNSYAIYGSHGMIDTRDTNESPAWYMKNHGNGSVWEFKKLTAIGFTAPSTTFGPVETITPWKDASGGLPRQVTYEGRNRWTRIATSETTWGAWQSDALLAYPVGSIYIAYNHTNPGTLFGGTWERITGAFLWASQAGDTIGQTGGEKTHTLTANEIPAHSHGSVYSGNASGTKTHAWLASGGSAMAYGTVSTGGGAAHNNMPPYIQVSIWRRTA